MVHYSRLLFICIKIINNLLTINKVTSTKLVKLWHSRYACKFGPFLCDLGIVFQRIYIAVNKVFCVSTWGECRSLWASSRKTAQPEPPDAPPPDCHLDTSGLSKGSKVKDVKGGVIFTWKYCNKRTDPCHPDLWVSLWVCGTAPGPFLHWGTKRGREQGPRSQSGCFCCFSVDFTVKFGSNLQRVQGLSTPPRLSLHIHYVWLQLHHLLLQFTHLGLDTHTWVLVFLKSMWILLAHIHTLRNTLNSTWPQLTALCSISLHTPRSFSDATKCKKTNIWGKLNWSTFSTWRKQDSQIKL